MGKRSNFPRHHRDDYATPSEAFQPLIPFLKWKKLVEPCPGEGKLTRHMRKAGFKVTPIHADARSYCYDLVGETMFVTNPPWTRSVLHPIIVNLSDQAPTWLLMDADWAHLLCARPYLNRLRAIVSVGRVKWFPNSGGISLDNSAWYLFEYPSRRVTRFYGRQ
jgi:hypothetical protein